MLKSLSSTNIAELLEAELNSIKDIQSVVVKAKLNSRSLKAVANTLDSVKMVIGRISDIIGALNKLKLSNPFKLMQLKLRMKLFTKIVESIVDLCVYIQKNAKHLKNDALQAVVTMTSSLADIAKNVLLFSLVSGFGIVFAGGSLALLALRGFVWIFTTLFGKTLIEELKNSAKAIRELALTVLLLSTSVIALVLTGVLIAESWPAFLMVSAYLVVITTIFFGVSLIIHFLKEIEADKSLVYIASVVMMLSLSVVALVLAGKLIEEEWQSLLIVSAYLGVLVTAFMLLSVATRWVQNGGKTLMYLAVAVAILSVTAVIMVATSTLVESNWQAIGYEFAMLAVLVGTAIGIGLAAKMINSGIKGIIALAASYIVIAGAIYIISASSQNLTWETIGIFSAIVGLMTAITIGLGVPAVAAFATTGAGILLMIAGAMLGVSTSLLLIAKTMEKIQAMGFNENNTAALTFPIEFMGKVCKTIAEKVDGGDLFEATFKCGALASVAVNIGRMATVISDIANLRIPTALDKDGNPTAWREMTTEDFVNATTSALAITSLLTGMFADKKQSIVLPNGETITFEPLSQDALDNITISAKRKIERLSKVTAAIGNMAKVVSDVAALRMPVSFDKDGKPTAYQAMTAQDFTAASQNIAIIATTILGALSDENLVNQIEDMSKRSIQKMKMIFDACGSIGSVTDAIKQMAVFQIADQFDEKTGKAIHYKVLTNEEIMAAEHRVVDIMTFFLRSMASEEMSDMLEDLDSDAAENMKIITDSCSGISDIISAIEKAYNFDEEQIQTGINKIQSILCGYTTMLYSLFNENSHLDVQMVPGLFGTQIPSFKKVIDSAALIDIKAIEDSVAKLNSVEKTLKPFKNIVETINNIKVPETEETNTKNTPLVLLQDYVKAVGAVEKFNEGKVKRNVDNLTKFIDKSNSINVDKIKTVTEMFGKIAEFSATIDGNFEKLAEVLNDKVADTLDDIATSLKVIRENPNSTRTAAPTPVGKSEVENNTPQPQQTVDLSEIEQDVAMIKNAIVQLIDVFDKKRS